MWEVFRSKNALKARAYVKRNDHSMPKLIHIALLLILIAIYLGLKSHEVSVCILTLLVLAFGLGLAGLFLD